MKILPLIAWNRGLAASIVCSFAGLWCLVGTAHADPPAGVVPADKIASAVKPPLTRSVFGPRKEVRQGYVVEATRSLGAQRSLAMTEVVVEAEARIDLPNIIFKLNSSSELADEVGKGQLVELARALGNSGTAEFLVEGHTCSLGSDETNNRLSAERAEFVKSQLILAGVPASSLKAIGCGSAEPRKLGIDAAAGEAVLAPYRKVTIFKLAAK